MKPGRAGTMTHDYKRNGTGAQGPLEDGSKTLLPVLMIACAHSRV